MIKIPIFNLITFIQQVKAEPAPVSNPAQSGAFTPSGDPEKDKKIRNLKKVLIFVLHNYTKLPIEL